MNQCVVRVGTEAYKRGNTYYLARTLRVLQSKTEYDLLRDECNNIGTVEALQNIINLDKVEDGVYNLITTNVYYDIESGYPDDWELKLVPYGEG